MADANGKTEEDVSKTIIHLIGSKLWVTEQKKWLKKDNKNSNLRKESSVQIMSKYESHAN